MSSRWSSASNSQRVEHGAAFHGLGVDALLDEVQVDPDGAEIRAEVDQVLDGAGEPVQARDLEHVAVAELVQERDC